MKSEVEKPWDCDPRADIKGFPPSVCFCTWPNILQGVGGTGGQGLGLESEKYRTDESCQSERLGRSAGSPLWMEKVIHPNSTSHLQWSWICSRWGFLEKKKNEGFEEEKDQVWDVKWKQCLRSWEPQPGGAGAPISRAERRAEAQKHVLDGTG